MAQWYSLPSFHLCRSCTRYRRAFPKTLTLTPTIAGRDGGRQAAHDVAQPRRLDRAVVPAQRVEERDHDRTATVRGERDGLAVLVDEMERRRLACTGSPRRRRPADDRGSTVSASRRRSRRATSGTRRSAQRLLSRISRVLQAGRRPCGHDTHYCNHRECRADGRASSLAVARMVHLPYRIERRLHLRQAVVRARRGGERASSRGLITSRGRRARARRPPRPRPRRRRAARARKRSDRHGARTVHRPPCACAIAATMARPSPTPPCARVRASSARAKRSKMLAIASSGMPDPSSTTSMTISPPTACARERDRGMRLRVLDRVLEQRVERAPQRLGIGAHDAGDVELEPPQARRDLRPAHEDVLEEARRWRRRAERRSPVARPSRGAAGGRRCAPSAPARRARPRAPACPAPRGQQLEVAARDRDGGAQLVRRVVQEPLAAARAAKLVTVGTASTCAHGRLTPPRVPDHCEEHRRHERHLEQLAPQLDSVERVARGCSRRSRATRCRGSRAPSRAGDQTRNP